jgi:telomere length regulation protein
MYTPPLKGCIDVLPSLTFWVSFFGGLASRTCYEHGNAVMSDFLTPVTTTAAKRGKDSDKQLDTLPTSSVEGRCVETVTIESPDHVSKILRGQPDLQAVSKILRYLTSASKGKSDFNLVTPSAVSAQIVDALVSQTIPDYWKSFKESRPLVKELISCLRSANGLGAILSRLRPLIADCRQKKSLNNTRDPSAHIEDLIDVLENVLFGDRTSTQIYQEIQKYSQNPTQGKLMWKEYVSQVASGRILGLVAEAEDVLKERGTSRRSSWLGTGRDYALWLGRNIAVLMKEALSEADSLSAVTELCGKAVGLGYLGLS